MQTVGDGVPDVPCRVYEAEGYNFVSSGDDYPPDYRW